MPTRKYVNIPVTTKTIEPLWWTVIFKIDGVCQKHQGAYYNLEDAISGATDWHATSKASANNLWWYFSNTISDIKYKFKHCK